MKLFKKKLAEYTLEELRFVMASAEREMRRREALLEASPSIQLRQLPIRPSLRWKLEKMLEVRRINPATATMKDLVLSLEREDWLELEAYDKGDFRQLLDAVQAQGLDIYRILPHLLRFVDEERVESRAKGRV